jgi:hypothetical protein
MFRELYNKLLGTKLVLQNFLGKFKMIHVPYRKTSHSICSNNCAVIIYSDIQTRGEPPTCFGLFGHLQGGIQQRKNTRIFKYVAVVQ